MSEVYAFKEVAFYLEQIKIISDCDKYYEDEKIRKMLNEWEGGHFKWYNEGSFSEEVILDRKVQPYENLGKGI